MDNSSIDTATPAASPEPAENVPITRTKAMRGRSQCHALTSPLAAKLTNVGKKYSFFLLSFASSSTNISAGCLSGHTVRPIIVQEVVESDRRPGNCQPPNTGKREASTASAGKAKRRRVASNSPEGSEDEDQTMQDEEEEEDTIPVESDVPEKKDLQKGKQRQLSRSASSSSSLVPSTWDQSPPATSSTVSSVTSTPYEKKILGALEEAIRCGTPLGPDAAAFFQTLLLRHGNGSIQASSNSQLAPTVPSTPATVPPQSQEMAPPLAPVPAPSMAPPLAPPLAPEGAPAPASAPADAVALKPTNAGTSTASRASIAVEDKKISNAGSSSLPAAAPPATTQDTTSPSPKLLEALLSSSKFYGIIMDRIIDLVTFDLVPGKNIFNPARCDPSAFAPVPDPDNRNTLVISSRVTSGNSHPAGLVAFAFVFHSMMTEPNIITSNDVRYQNQEVAGALLTDEGDRLCAFVSDVLGRDKKSLRLFVYKNKKSAREGFMKFSTVPTEITDPDQQTDASEVAVNDAFFAPNVSASDNSGNLLRHELRYGNEGVLVWDSTAYFKTGPQVPAFDKNHFLTQLPGGIPRNMEEIPNGAFCAIHFLGTSYRKGTSVPSMTMNVTALTVLVIHLKYAEKQRRAGHRHEPRQSGGLSWEICKNTSRDLRTRFKCFNFLPLYQRKILVVDSLAIEFAKSPILNNGVADMDGEQNQVALITTDPESQTKNKSFILHYMQKVDRWGTHGFYHDLPEEQSRAIYRFFLKASSLGNLETDSPWKGKPQLP
ncbi:hypothetical protein EVG20_g11007, partial [Dentipellis fragilis]